jgi:hypothetical protein
MCRALPGSEYYGGSAPPGPFSCRCAYPGQRAGCPPAGNRDRAVPVFTAARSAEEEPGCVPAASPQVRRRPSPWPPGTADLNGPGSSRRERKQRDAPRPAHIRQIRAGLQVKDVKRRFLSYSSPPRSPGPPHLAVLERPGFVGAAPTLPGTTRIRLPPAPPPCCDRTEAKVSHLHSSNSASRRKRSSIEAPVRLTGIWLTPTPSPHRARRP